MIHNFLKVIFRYLSRSRFFTFLNIVGLAIGMGCCVVIYLFVVNELSYDKFHSNRDNIYRVIRKSQINGMPYDIGITAANFSGALKQDFQGRINDATRVFNLLSVVRFEDKMFMEDRLMLADKNFFQFFSYPLETGDPKSVLQNPSDIVISKSFAKKYFGDEDPIGKVLRVDEQYDLKVTGVLAELPGNTHLQFDAVGSIALLENQPWYTDWWGNAFGTYVAVDNPDDVDYLNASFDKFMDKYFGADFQRVGNRIGLQLEPLKEIYFNYGTRYESNVAHGDKRYVFVFSSIGILLILLAAINYINLATAQASERAKEVGIRKTLGSTKSNVAFQFLSESFVLCFVSMLLAIGLAQTAIPFFNSSFGLHIPGIFEDKNLLIFLGGLLITISIAAGAYPAFMLSSFKPVRVLKGDMKGDSQFLFVRKSLIVFQFGISALMIIATLFVREQVDFMREKDLGFKSDELMYIQINNTAVHRAHASFKERILQTPGVQVAAFSSGRPGGFYDASTIHIEGTEENIRMRTLWADEDFTTAMDLKIVSGRFFSKDFPADSASSVLLNETAVSQLGWKPEDAVGKRVMLSQFDSTYKEIVGVVKDYHFTSVKEKIEPLIISYRNRGGNLMVRLTGDVKTTIASIEEIWNSYNSGFPLEFHFMDDVIDRLYRSENIQGKMFSVFSIISVVIACLGILGLAAFIASQRKKEIGIRKVLGATAQQVTLLLMRDLLTLVAVSILIAVPVGYYAIQQWSAGFAYRVPISPVVFVVGSLIVIIIAATIIGLNAMKVAMQNPVKSLRSE